MGCGREERADGEAGAVHRITYTILVYRHGRDRTGHDGEWSISTDLMTLQRGFSFNSASCPPRPMI